LPMMISGAKYSGVPIKVLARGSFVQQPKSTSYA